MALNIVLHQPEIPHNTGAIGRTCLMTGARLHLVRPFGFFLDEKSLIRSGLDYWHKLQVSEYDDFHDFANKNPDANFYLVESGTNTAYTDVTFSPGDFLIFGSETTGLPMWLMEKYPDKIITIPMIGKERSLNLSVATGIVLYEALRQLKFPGLINGG